MVTWPVLTETCHLLLSRLGPVAQARFLQQVSANVEVHEIGSERLDTLAALMEKYRDLPMDLADASLILAATDLDEARILSTDRRDFNTYRWKDQEPFSNLLTEL